MATVACAEVPAPIVLILCGNGVAESEPTVDADPVLGTLASPCLNPAPNSPRGVANFPGLGSETGLRRSAQDRTRTTTFFIFITRFGDQRCPANSRYLPRFKPTAIRDYRVAHRSIPPPARDQSYNSGSH